VQDLIERVASEKRPADDDWTNRLGLLIHCFLKITKKITLEACHLKKLE